MPEDKPLNEQPAEQVPQDEVQPSEPLVESAPAMPVNPSSQPQQSAPVMPVQQPIGSAQPMMGAPAMTPVQKPKKKWLLPVIILSIVVLVLSGGGIGAYAWYQSPQKIVDDGLMSMMSAKSGKLDGQATISMDDAKITMTFKSQSNDTAGQQSVTIKIEAPSDSPYSVVDGLETSVDVVLDQQDMTFYLRVNDLQAAYEMYRDAMIETLQSLYTGYGYDIGDAEIAAFRDQIDEMMMPTVKKLDGQWLKLNASDIDQTTSTDVMSCVSDALKKASDDSAVQEIIDTYKANAFVNPGESLGTKNGSVGYVLDFDQNKAAAFRDALKETAIGKDIAACDIPDEDTVESENVAAEATAELWVDQWSHQVRHITVKGSNDDKSVNVTMDLNVELNTDVTVEIPSDAKTFDEIQSDIENLLSATGSI